MFSMKIPFFLNNSIYTVKTRRKAFLLSESKTNLSSVVGCAFRHLPHFPDTVHHLAVFTALESFDQETLKHETKQALTFLFNWYLFSFYLGSSFLVPYSKERTDKTRAQFMEQV